MPKLDKHYTDPRLVQIYDIENPRGIDTDFYLNLANELNAEKIIDLGCGTGLLTRELASTKRSVIGVDPSSAMLDYAQRQPNAENVTWIEGDANTLRQSQADLVVMTGNVAQVFLTDSDWMTTLKSIHHTLKSGGCLAFETRNPDARGWEKWNRENSYFEFESPNGPMSTWVEVTEIKDNLVYFNGHNIIKNTGENIIVESALRFRNLEEISKSLDDVGFTIKNIFGYWDKTPHSEQSSLMIFIAQRT